MKLELSLALACAMSISAGGVQAAKAPKDPIKVTSPKAIAGLKSFVIGGFSVAFVSEKTDAAFAGRQFQKVGSITKAKLAGVTAVEFQAITDAAYADFVAKMTAAGYTIADRGTMLADKTMAKVSFEPSGTEGTIQFGKDAKAKALFFGPTAFGSAPLMKGEISAGAPTGVFSTFNAMSAMSPAMAKGYYVTGAKQPMLTVVYVIDFADADRYGGSFAYEANVTVKAGIAVVDTLSMISTLNDKGLAGNLTLAQPVAIGGNFGDLVDSTTRGQKIDNALGTAIGILGGVGTNSYKRITFTAVPELYRAGATEAAIATNTRMVDRLATLR